jgi:hypothetical protein
MSYRPTPAEDPIRESLPNPAPGERLLIEAMRRWATHRMAGVRPHHAVRCLMSWKASDRAAALFTAWMEEVEASRSRPIHMQCANCGGLSDDEQRLVVSVGVAPLNLMLAEKVTSTLLHEPGRLAVLSRALNAALTAADMRVPARICAGAVEVAAQTPGHRPANDHDVRPTLH